ncbi:MAG: glycosyltransferase [candidate division KSB1 bacterium]|nr:glycosyltransferase [candidate division KSB1 bacterium]
MRIAIMGIRGIPANYGGFETFAEELSTRLVEKGHQVTVYGRSNIIKYSERYYKGVELVVLPTISHKYFDTVAHTFLCVFHALTRKFDVVLICNSANAIFSFVPRLKGQKVAVNVDGLEWQRDKWNLAGQLFYRISEFLATFLPDQVVTDSTFIREYYWRRFKKFSTYIPYGAPTQKVPTLEVLKKFKVEPNRYILYVSRLEPENNAHLVVKAFEQVKTDLKLVVVGDAPYSTKYIQDLKSTKDPRIIFTGYVFGQGYREFQSHAYFYVQATEVGGTHPALLEGMGFGNCVLANDVPEHREVMRDSGIFFKTSQQDDLRDKMQYLVDHPEVVKAYQAKAVARIEEAYTWNRIADQYEGLFSKMNGR